MNDELQRLNATFALRRLSQSPSRQHGEGVGEANRPGPGLLVRLKAAGVTLKRIAFPQANFGSSPSSCCRAC